MIIKTNIPQFTEAMREKFELLGNKEYLLRPVMFGLVDLMTKRIHIDGKAADGNQIGTYSTGYMKLRSHTLPPTVTRGKNKGNARKYDSPNRGTDTKVVVSLTRQLEDNWIVEATQNGYGIGFINDFNYNKSQWVEETYKKPIFQMTETESAYALDYINDLVNQALE